MSGIKLVTKSFDIDDGVSLDTGTIKFTAKLNGATSGGGTRDYEKLINQPSVNNVTLVGNKTSKQIHVQHEMKAISEQEIDKIIFGG